jgi:hypothetical protein
MLLCILLDMESPKNTDITSVLQQIASDTSKQSIDDSYNDPGGAVKEFGGGMSNNMILRSIYSETKRNADESARLNSKLNALIDAMNNMTSAIEQLSDLTESQNTIIASQYSKFSESTNNTVDRQSNSRKQQLQGSGMWFYDGINIKARNLQCACLISQFIAIVKTKLDQRGIYYPDSVDCEFTVLGYCITEVTGVRCTIPSVTFKNQIEFPSTTSPVYSKILPLIASSRQYDPALLSESRLDEIQTPMTRSYIESVERVIDRLCKLEHILSPIQIDILRSFQTPIIKDGELNFNIDMIQPRQSHPLANEISQLTPTGKKTYIRQIMKNENHFQAYQTAREKITK